MIQIPKIATPATSGMILAVVMVGCTGMHKAGSIAGVAPSGAVPSLREQGCGVPEPNCAAPGPSCGYQEPSCAAPSPCAAHGAGPCGCASCAPQHVHEHVQAPPTPKPQGDLALGGGALTIPLPILQLPGCFRVPAVRSAVLPVAEPILVETPVAPAVTGSAAIVQPATTVVPVAAAVTGSAAPVERIPVLLVDRARVTGSSGQVTGSSGQADQPQCLCDEELDAFLEAIRARLNQGAATGSSGQPTPAPLPSQAETQAEIDRLRQSVIEAERAVDEALKKVQEQQSAAAGATP